MVGGIRGASGGRRAVALLLATSLAWSVVPSGAPAFELFGLKLFESDKGETAVVPDAQPYELDFQVSGDEETKEALQNASSLYRDRERPPPGTAGLLARARGDYGRLVAALYARGNYGGVIRILVGGREPEAIPADSELPDPVAVSVSVDPGPLFRFGEIAISGLPEAIETDEEEAILDWRKLNLKTGEIARSGAILAAEGALREVWRQRGHPKVQIASREITADHRTHTVDVALRVEPGPAAGFGPVTITGTERMNPEFVARQTGLKVGEPYDPDRLARARERLRRLEVFSSVSVQEAEFIDEAGLVPITFNLAERKRRVIGGGASVSTTEGVALEAYWQHRNLFGQAESLRLEGAVSRIGAEDYKNFSYTAGMTFRKPGTFTPDTDLTLQVFGRREFVDTYERRSVYARAGLTHRFTDELTGSSAINIERSRVEDAFGINDYMILSLPSELLYDSRDEKLDPTRGINALAQLEPFYDFEGSTAALIGRVSAATYLSLDENDRMILAGRVALGSILSTGGLEDIPADRRFFLGGGGSIRGYEYRTVGPEIGGDVVGGRSFWEASAEIRFKVTNTIGIVPFIDAGAAYVDSFPDFSEDIRVGAGIGLRYYTGLGPIRFDLAVPLVRREDDPSVAFYVGLGQAF